MLARAYNEGMSRIELAKMILFKAIFSMNEITSIPKLTKREVEKLKSRIENGNFKPKKHKS